MFVIPAYCCDSSGPTCSILNIERRAGGQIQPFTHMHTRENKGEDIETELTGIPQGYSLIWMCVYHWDLLTCFRNGQSEHVTVSHKLPNPTLAHDHKRSIWYPQEAHMMTLELQNNIDYSNLQTKHKGRWIIKKESSLIMEIWLNDLPRTPHEKQERRLLSDGLSLCQYIRSFHLHTTTWPRHWNHDYP